MKRTGKRRRRLAAIATGVLLLAGGAAAIAAGGGEGKIHHSQARATAPRLTLRDLRAAATYLGVPPAELASELRSGKSLDEVAAATPGKSAAGVVGALTSAKRRRLNVLSATLAERATREASGHVKSIGGLRRLARAPEATGAAARSLSAAAAYLGVSQQKLESALPGHTLAEVTAATHGKSVSGLIAALTSPRRERLNAGVGAHRLSQAGVEAANARLSRRAAAIVNRRYPAS